MNGATKAGRAGMLWAFSCLLLASCSDGSNERGATGAPSAQQLFPLAEGKSWTYRWTVGTAGGQAKCMNNSAYSYGIKSMTITTGQPVDATNQHEETYTILRAAEGRYYFSISTQPKGARPVRDGRYEDARCQYWQRIVKEDNSSGVIERIEREWRRVIDASPVFKMTGKAAPGEWIHDVVGDGPVPTNEFPIDHNDLMLVRPGQQGGSSTYELYRGSKSRITFDSSGKTVMTPAGTFPGCFECMVETRSREDALLWETHTLYAPGVGMVREYQKLPGGAVSYQLDLLRFGHQPGQ